MVDSVSPKVRSLNMAQIKSKGTKPEMQVRRLLHRLGYRFRLHRNDLQGNPDVVFVSKKKAIFVNGCFWHQHPNCKRARIPRSNREYWSNKLLGNRARDIRNTALLEADGWDVMTVWECQLRDLEALANELTSFLGLTKQSLASSIDAGV